MRRSARARDRRWLVGIGLTVTVVLFSGSCGGTGGTGGGGPGYLIPSVCASPSGGGGCA